MSARHFLTLFDLTAAELKQVLARAQELKAALKAGDIRAPLPRKTMAMIFEKSSTRTRVSFETGMAQLGGTSLFLSPRDTHLDRGEPVEDTARVMSRMVDVIVTTTGGAVGAYHVDTVELVRDAAAADTCVLTCVAPGVWAL